MNINLKRFAPFAGFLIAGAALLPITAMAQETGGMAGMTCCQPRQVAQADTKPAPKAPPAVTTDKKGVQKATVTIDGGYTPASLSVKAGKPVEITFIRKSAEGCDGQLVIPDLKIDKTLKQGEKTVVKFTPKKSGAIAFQCGMGMYKGQIAVK